MDIGIAERAARAGDGGVLLDELVNSAPDALADPGTPGTVRPKKSARP
ncbi:hypothetical protein [Streptomyces sp. DW26H14]